MNILTDEDEEPINEATAKNAVTSRSQFGTLKRNSYSSPTLAKLAHLMEGNLIDAKVNIPGISTSQRSLPRLDLRHDSITSLTSVSSTRSTSSTPKTPKIPKSGNINRYQMADNEETYYAIDEDEESTSKPGKPKIKKKKSSLSKLKNQFNKITKFNESKVAADAKAYVPFDPDQFKDDILDEASAYPSGQEYSQEDAIYSSIDDDVYQSPEVMPMAPQAPQAPPMIMGMSRPMSPPIKLKSPPGLKGSPMGTPIGPPKGIPGGGVNPFMAELNKKLQKRSNSGTIPVKIPGVPPVPSKSSKPSSNLFKQFSQLSRSDSSASTASIKSPDSAKIFSALGITENEEALKSLGAIQEITPLKKGGSISILKKNETFKNLQRIEASFQNLNLAVGIEKTASKLPMPKKPQLKIPPQKTMLPKPVAKPVIKKPSSNFLATNAMGGANDELANLLKKRRPKSFMPEESNTKPEESNPESEESKEVEEIYECPKSIETTLPMAEESNPESEESNEVEEIYVCPKAIENLDENDEPTNPDPEQEVSVPDGASKTEETTLETLSNYKKLQKSNMPLANIGLPINEQPIATKGQTVVIPQEPSSSELEVSVVNNDDYDSPASMIQPVNYVAPTDSPSLPKKRRSFRNSFRKNSRGTKERLQSKASIDESDTDNIEESGSGFIRKESRKSKKLRNRSGNDKLSPTADPDVENKKPPNVFRNRQKSLKKSTDEAPPLPKKSMSFKKLQYERILSGAINPKDDLDHDYIQDLLNDINRKILYNVMSDSD